VRIFGYTTKHRVDCVESLYTWTYTTLVLALKTKWIPEEWSSCCYNIV